MCSVVRNPSISELELNHDLKLIKKLGISMENVF